LGGNLPLGENGSAGRSLPVCPPEHLSAAGPHQVEAGWQRTAAAAVGPPVQTERALVEIVQAVTVEQHQPTALRRSHARPVIETTLHGDNGHAVRAGQVVVQAVEHLQRRHLGVDLERPVDAQLDVPVVQGPVAGGGQQRRQLLMIEPVDERRAEQAGVVQLADQTAEQGARADGDGGQPGGDVVGGVDHGVDGAQAVQLTLLKSVAIRARYPVTAAWHGRPPRPLAGGWLGVDGMGGGWMARCAALLRHVTTTFLL